MKAVKKTWKEMKGRSQSDEADEETRSKRCSRRLVCAAMSAARRDPWPTRSLQRSSSDGKHVRSTLFGRMKGEMQATGSGEAKHRVRVLPGSRSFAMSPVVPKRLSSRVQVKRTASAEPVRRDVGSSRWRVLGREDACFGR